MFGKADKTVGGSAQGIPSILSADLRIEGNLRCVGDLQIDGAISGDVVTRTLTLGEGAEVKGSIEAESVRICGRVEGEIRAATVLITRTAKVIGDILHEDLTIESGAFMEGQCRRLKQSGDANKPADAPQASDRDKPGTAGAGPSLPAAALNGAGANGRAEAAPKA
jgi:cytoskeletal protein CcmA (bactofilin family)